MSVDGVLDYKNLQINNSNENLIVSYTDSLFDLVDDKYFIEKNTDMVDM